MNVQLIQWVPSGTRGAIRGHAVFKLLDSGLILNDVVVELAPSTELWRIRMPMCKGLVAFGSNKASYEFQLAALFVLSNYLLDLKRQELFPGQPEG